MEFISKELLSFKDGMKKGLFIRKSMKSHFTEVEEGQHSLKRHLGVWNLTAVGIGGIIGAGIFVITGQAAAQLAGPGIAISCIIAAIICCLAGLCYAELSSLIPVSGGAYSYAYVAMGEFPAWLVGWAITAQYLISSATVAVGWSGYFVSFLADFGIQLPEAWSRAPLIYDVATGWEWSGAILNLPAIAIILFLGTLIAVGIRAAAQFNNAMVFTKLIMIILFIFLGAAYVNTDHWVPFIPENTGVFGEFGWTGIVRAAGLVFFAYIGFDSVSTLAQEAVHPQRDLPRGILGSLAISTVIYVALCLVLTGMVSYTFLNVPDPMSLALDIMGPSMFWFRFLMKFAILAALASVVLVQMLGQTRVVLAVAQDGLLPKAFSEVHPRLRTPVFATAVTTLFAMAVAGIFSVQILGSLVCMSTLFVFAIVCLGVWVLRHTHPEYERPFKVPCVPWVPLAGILACVGQMAFFPIATWTQVILWFGLGLFVYFAYGIKHSKIRK